MFGCNVEVKTSIKSTDFITPKQLEALLNEIKNYNGGKVLSFDRVSEFLDNKARYIIRYEYEVYW